MKDKISELIGSIKINEANLIRIAETKVINGSLYVDLNRVIKEAIQFASHLTAERAKEKIEKAYWHSIEKSNGSEIYTVDKDEVLQSIQESKL
jgi:hypothetical protein